MDFFSRNDACSVSGFWIFFQDSRIGVNFEFSRLTHHILYRLFVVWKCPPVLHVCAVCYLGQLWNKFDLWISGHNFLCTQRTFHWKYLQCDSYRWSPGAYNEFKKIETAYFSCKFYGEPVLVIGKKMFTVAIATSCDDPTQLENTRSTEWVSHHTIGHFGEQGWHHFEKQKKEYTNEKLYINIRLKRQLRFIHR